MSSSILPKGFRAAGLPRKDRPRPSRHGLAFFYSETPATAAACFTTNRVKCVHIPIDQTHLKKGKAQAIMINSGCANCCTGARGIKEAKETMRWASEALGIPASLIQIASTGVIGDFMPMDLLKEEIPLVAGQALSDQGLTAQGFHKAAEAIMTTDTTVKIAHQTAVIQGKEIRVWGCAKGAGMIHPLMTLTGEVLRPKSRVQSLGPGPGTRDLGQSLRGRHATMLGFVLTDASVPQRILESVLSEATNQSFNRVTVDGDMSTNDSIFLLANGASGISITSKNQTLFAQAVQQVCEQLAKLIAKDGEGASKFLEIRVDQARTVQEAQQLAMTVATSPLVKTAAYGEDSNWGRILAALGRSGVAIDPAKIDIYFADLCVFKRGSPTAVSAEDARAPLKAKDVVIRIVAHQGKAQGLYWTCDFTGQYVDINARYRT